MSRAAPRRPHPASRACRSRLAATVGVPPASARPGRGGLSPRVWPRRPRARPGHPPGLPPANRPGGRLGLAGVGAAIRRREGGRPRPWPRPARNRTNSCARAGLPPPRTCRDALDPLGRRWVQRTRPMPRRRAATGRGSDRRDGHRHRAALEGRDRRPGLAADSPGIVGPLDEPRIPLGPGTRRQLSLRPLEGDRIVAEIVERNRLRPLGPRLRRGIDVGRPRNCDAAAPPSSRRAGSTASLIGAPPGDAPGRVRRALHRHQPLGPRQSPEIDGGDAQQKVRRDPAVHDTRRVVAGRQGNPRDPHRTARGSRGGQDPASELRRQVAPLGLRPGRNDQQLLALTRAAQDGRAQNEPEQPASRRSTGGLDRQGNTREIPGFTPVSARA